MFFFRVGLPKRAQQPPRARVAAVPRVARLASVRGLGGTRERPDGSVRGPAHPRPRGGQPSLRRVTPKDVRAAPREALPPQATGGAVVVLAG